MRNSEGSLCIAKLATARGDTLMKASCAVQGGLLAQISPKGASIFHSMTLQRPPKRCVYISCPASLALSEPTNRSLMFPALFQLTQSEHALPLSLPPWPTWQIYTFYHFSAWRLVAGRQPQARVRCGSAKVRQRTKQACSLRGQP